ncbi:Glycolate dehydrogenase, FAD-binding subunit GlcE [plant metagenome]|uniref:Glycolate dehydrogenase, FAD-binding subunit GlcE n=1 Tax=plant metagenome TaxID=1297885 RepID=A0A484Q2K3_9ZZZZ
MEFVLSELCDQVMTASAAHRPLHVGGGGTKAFYGNGRATQGEPRHVLDMTAYRGVVTYEPSELVVTVRAGTPLAELEATLAEQGQMLAFEPPHFGADATVGGCVAAGLAGPRRMAAGGVRDFVLGVRLLDAQGRVLRFGGEVMKNVAGYDVSRLLAGSQGIFGALLDVSLKVVPRPIAEATLRLQMGQAQALAQFGTWRGKPLPISATAWSQAEGPADSGILTVRLSGAPAAVDGARRLLGGERMADGEAQAWWHGLREQTHPFLAQGPLWRLAVPPITPPLGLGPTLIEWGGGQRWLAGGHLSAASLRAAAAQVGGHATLFRAGEAGMPADGVFHPLAPAVAAITRRLKEEFDPLGIFNPGRMIPGL